MVGVWPTAGEDGWALAQFDVSTAGVTGRQLRIRNLSQSIARYHCQNPDTVAQLLSQQLTSLRSGALVFSSVGCKQKEARRSACRFAARASNSQG